MGKYAYPAIFTPAEEGGFLVDFPDLEGCHTEGNNMAEAIYMAEDALALIIYGYESDNRQLPIPSSISKLSHGSNSFINYIACDTLKYRKMYNNKAVKKTLTIPEWLNEYAIASNINFSQLLQEALMNKIGIK